MSMPSSTQVPAGQFQLSMTSFFSAAVFVVLLVLSVILAALFNQVNPVAGVVTGVTGALLSALVASTKRVFGL